MIHALVILFLAAHGLVHVAVYLAPAPAAAGRRAPFDPAHSWALAAAHVTHDREQALARSLALTTALGFTVAAAGVIVGGDWAPMLMIGSAGMGLVLKGLFYNPWLSVGVLLDVIIISAAITAMS